MSRSVADPAPARSGRVARWLSRPSRDVDRPHDRPDVRPDVQPDSRPDGRPGSQVRDVLTGLAVREELVRWAPHLLTLADARQRPAALLLLDLDAFKGLNDSAGHHVGDRVLAAVGARLREVSHPGDLLVRLGGDEFAVVTAPLRHRSAAAERATAMIEAIGAPLEIDDLRIAVGVSIGLAMYGEDGTTVDELLRAADQAMYAAKAAGSGLWRASTPDARPEPGLTRRLIGELRAGLAVDQLVVHYQPQLGVACGEVVGFEALARWDHPELGLLAPRHFIPLAERSGLMGPLTDAVLERALGDLPRLQESAPGARLSVNVSRRHILGRGLVEGLSDRVRRHGASPEELVLEITEPVTRSSSETESTFAGLSRQGFGVSIRGFGTARSSLTALWANPAVREVKVDPSIVGALADDRDRSPADPDGGRRTPRLVRALASAAHGLGIRVVAEGVENSATVDAAQDLGCDVVQGFWICEPVPVESAAEWCATWRRAAAPR